MIKNLNTFNSRRFFRLDVELPIVDWKITDKKDISQDLSQKDFYSLNIDYFTEEKKFFLESKKTIFNGKFNLATKEHPKVKNIFKKLSKKAIIANNFIEMIIKGCSPFSDENGLGYIEAKNDYDFLKNNINLKVLENSPMTKDIIFNLDSKISTLGTKLFNIPFKSDYKSIFIEYMPVAFLGDEKIDNLRKKSKNKKIGILAEAFLAYEDYLNELLKIYENYLYIISKDDDNLKKEIVNLSCGGIKKHFKYHLKNKDKVGLKFKISLPELKELGFSDDIKDEIIECYGEVVYSYFDNKIGDWIAAVNFDIIEEKKFNRINSFLQNSEIIREKCHKKGW